MATLRFPVTKLKPSARLLAINYALTTLLSALLLFEVQPIISKYILPWFGGSPAVWTTCMVFFQTVLFAGYAYAHFVIRFLRPRWQAVVHFSLLAVAVCMLPIAPDESWKLQSGAAPTWSILCLLGVTVGLPYFALSSTGPLIQAWFSQSFADRSPYRLYALSNFGSLVGLLAYPFFVEPRFALDVQTWVWSLAFVGFAVLCAIAALSAGAVARRLETLFPSVMMRTTRRPPGGGAWRGWRCRRWPRPCCWPPRTTSARTWR